MFAHIITSHHVGQPDLSMPRQQPGGTAGLRALDPGECFLFKLKSPYNAIGGGGFFMRYIKLLLTVAWDAFEQKNGVAGVAAKGVAFRFGY